MGLITIEETKVVEAVAEGRTIKEVATFLNKSQYTVINQLQSVYNKLNIPHNTNALTAWYICRIHGIDIPEFLRKVGAVVLLVIMSFTIYTHDDQFTRTRSASRTVRSLRRCGRRDNLN